MPDDGSGPMLELGMGEPPPNPEPVEFTELELEALGPLDGRRVLDLTAGIGDHALGLARLGASVVAAELDSELDVEIAAIVAQEMGLDIWFDTGGYVALSDDLIEDGFDIVYAGPNTLVWVEELHDWFVDAADALVPGGRLVMFDEDPRAREAAADAGGADLEDDDDETETEELLEDALEEVFDEEFIPDIPDWSASDLLAGVAAAGLTLVKLDELTGQQRFTGAVDVLDDEVRAGLGDVPTAFLLVAEKPVE